MCGLTVTSFNRTHLTSPKPPNQPNPTPTQLEDLRHQSMILGICQNPARSWNLSSVPENTELIPDRSAKRTIIRMCTQASPNEQQQFSAGRIRRLVLTPEGRTKLNPKPDRDFYSYPRFVTHVDDNFISTLTNLYREKLNPEMEILDLMSSWVSHLPGEVKYKKVVGHGLNAQELVRNPRLDHFFVKDLNQDQEFQFEDCSFDAVLCTVSVQYLQQPEKVFAEVFRVLRPGGVFIVSFSNRLFYEKAISAWRDGTAYSRVQLVKQYLQCVEGFTEPQVIRKLPAADETSSGKESESPFSWLMNLVGSFSPLDPFYAVLAYRNFKPLHE